MHFNRATEDSDETPMNMSRTMEITNKKHIMSAPSAVLFALKNDRSMSKRHHLM